MLKVQEITKQFGARVILNSFSYEFPETGLVAIVGKSGIGKSTLLNIIAGLDKDYDGKVIINGQEIKQLDEEKLSYLRLSNIGYIYQNFNLLNLEKVKENILLPLDAISNSSKVVKNKRLLDVVNLLDIKHLLNKNVNKLSGGEKQRVAIARAIINEPKIILCDEPTGALDEKNSEIVLHLLKVLSRDSLIIVATHDVEGIKNIANCILKLSDQKVEEISNNNIANFGKDILMPCPSKSGKSRMPTLFKIKHNIHKGKTKKWRSLITNLMLSLSLTGIGVTFILNDSITNNINGAFSSILNGNQIIMTPKNSSSNSFSTAYSASVSKINYIFQKYADYLDGIGVNYLVNFEDFFKDSNSFEVYSGLKTHLLNNLSSRNVNDFVLLKDAGEKVYYPSKKETLENDEVVLGLTFEDMANLCYSLQIQRSYTSLGHYIYENGLNLLLKISNFDWQYDDEQLFKVASVCESKSSTLYHSNELWNEVVFEEMMRMKSDDDNQHYFPWEMNKIFYLKSKEDPQFFINDSMYDEELSDFVFERTNNMYNPLLCSQNRACLEKRIYVYLVDKFGINVSDIKKILKTNPTLTNYYFTSGYGYSSYASNLFSGFSKNVFVSFNQNLIDYAIDSDTNLSNANQLTLNLPPGIVQGNYLNSINDGLKFSTVSEKLMNGRLSKNNSEIVISRGLAKKLNGENAVLGKYLIFSGVVHEEIDANSNIKKTYNQAKLLVVGIVDEERNYLYQNNDWPISFFRDQLGISNFSLIPTGVIFELNENQNCSAIINNLNLAFTKYNFESPLLSLNNTLNSTLEYANIVIISFTILVILISIILLITIVLLDILESKNEIMLFKYIGFRQSDINSLYVFNSLIQGASAFLVSIFEIILLNFLTSKILSNSLNFSIDFSLNFKAIIIPFLVAIILPILVSNLVIFVFNIKQKIKIR